ncbi:hypothetical protein [Streptococcus cuniculipharyngis]|uniref:hypothetical protein n=1 Tax=Streptococcus cuniculipharyngis TaxID=1562651 RepID=UPI001FEA4049|nr:hypothetical protein [Streptococcus cuniculipharyngis]
MNDTTRESVVAALQSDYRHLDTAHGYYNEKGVGQAIGISNFDNEPEIFEDIMENAEI